jgi:8-oxo-dGTP diphosphatase
MNELPRVGSAVLIIDGNRILLGRRNKEPNRGKWVLPGGRVEPFESVTQAAKREVLEETGLEIEIDGYIGVAEIISRPDEHRVIHYSLGRSVAGEPRPGSDLSDVRFVAVNDLAGLDLSPVVTDVLQTLGWLDRARNDPGGPMPSPGAAGHKTITLPLNGAVLQETPSVSPRLADPA